MRVKLLFVAITTKPFSIAFRIHTKCLTQNVIQLCFSCISVKCINNIQISLLRICAKHFFFRSLHATQQKNEEQKMERDREGTIKNACPFLKLYKLLLAVAYFFVVENDYLFIYAVLLRSHRIF